MGVTTVTQEYTVPLPPATVFRGLVLDSHIVFPKAMPQTIKGLDLIQGQWGAPGCVTKTTFVQGFVKHKFDVVDKDNLAFKYALIEGDVVGDKIEYVAYEVKLEPSGSGCLCKQTTEYHTKGDFKVSEEEINASKEKNELYIKAVADYLLANPNNA